MQLYKRHFIEGIWSPTTDASQTIIVDPTTEMPCATVGHSSVDNVDAAVRAAARAFPEWSVATIETRAAILDRTLEGLNARAAYFISGMAREIGVPVWFGRLLQIPMPLKNGALAVGTIRTMAWSEFSGPSLVSRVPVGVVAAITPWNAPLHQIVAKVFPALAAGCTVVLKPSEIVPSTAVLFAEALESAGLPAGVFNLVWGDALVGAALCRHPLVDMISFTGSERGGQAVAESAGREIKRVVLELGGKSAAVLLDDAPLEKAVTTVLTACFANSGQTCVAQSRLLVQRDALKQVEELCREGVKTWPVGDPNDEGTRIGPLATLAQYDRVRGYIARGENDGASVIAGGLKGGRDRGHGYFVAPTVFTGVTSRMAIAQEEIFGPVLSLITYDDDDEAVAIANDTAYGLSGSVWGADATRATRVASRIRTGQVSLNGAPQNFLAPFGGFKKSGFGRENGRFGVDEFLQFQAIHGAPKEAAE